MKIKVLPESVINKISAGEVIERPASVVRELVDNSLDAGATEISVYLRNGGHSLIRVVDNGSGMGRDDAILAFERHATSKLRTDEDLSSIKTLGFRGEALSSIGAVSKVRLRTRDKESSVGVEVEVKGGKLVGVRDTSIPFGTDFESEGLFYNTPARRKFLRSGSTEEKKVKHWLLHSSIAHPHVHYRLYFDEREILTLPSRGSIIERGRELFKGNTILVEREIGGLLIVGVLAHPSLAEGHSDSLAILVNRRLVTDRMVIKAVKEGFFSTLKDREIPLGFLSIDLPSVDVDVNVHPQKSEVRFKNPQEVFLAIRNSVQTALKDFSSPMVMGLDTRNFFAREAPSTFNERPSRDYGAYGIPSSAKSVRLFDRHSNVTDDVRSFELNSAREEEIHPFRFSFLRYIGQGLSCYLFCEFDGAIYVVDMHAAHERYNFNLIRNGFRGRSTQSQKLLVPESIKLTEIGVANLLDHVATFEAFGFKIEESEPEVVMISEVPSLLVGRDIVSLVKEIASLPFGAMAQGSFEKVIDDISARIACHASIRSGDNLSKEEVYGLFEALDTAEFSAACPHGRPIIVEFTGKEIEKWFGRDR